jgi:flavin prenyltransferase
MPAKQRMIVGITGASGIAYGVRLLEILRQLGFESHLVITKAGDLTRAHETALTAQELRSMGDRHWHIGDIAAPIASGSFPTIGMVVAPCSIRTLSEIAHGTTDNLLTRAADVVLKERRRLVLMVRETPLHAGHIRSMAAVTEMGAIVFPPVPSFYTRPVSLQDVVDHSVGRVLDLFDIDAELSPRWGEPEVQLQECGAVRWTTERQNRQR